MIENYVIAVDGPAGSGKSTVCRKVAGIRGISYVDSGALYRGVTLYILQNCPSFEDVNYSQLLEKLNLSQVFHEDYTTSTYINGTDVSKEIRTEEVVAHINLVSSQKEVRDFITAELRAWSHSKSIIMDGRDIGSVVYPDAGVKIYLDASVDVRAQRRFDEYEASGKNVDLKSIKNQIIQRDNQDRLREHGALVECEDAISIDTSGMNIDEVVAHINAIADKKLNIGNGKSE